MTQRQTFFAGRGIGITHYRFQMEPQKKIPSSVPSSNYIRAGIRSFGGCSIPKIHSNDSGIPFGIIKRRTDLEKRFQRGVDHPKNHPILSSASSNGRCVAWRQPKTGAVPKVSPYRKIVCYFFEEATEEEATGNERIS
ncbi:hypothetical protein JTE90_009711 [Oedothorax gibbosus]|uniref:Uncharacterized protein n=1 Tax=Oedothorax gibbosus TaxID=931172 RepID=A0AAV6V999_9ARAC|nr:hypothetical protein JTE90_009711 [Oedothorax gibbosus]